MENYEIRKDDEELSVTTNDDGTIEISMTDWMAFRSIGIILNKEESDKLREALWV